MYFYLITLPTLADVDGFAEFMRNEYFPAIHKGATRFGQVKRMALLQSEPENGLNGREFVWQVDWDGLPLGRVAVDSADATRRFDAFKPVIKELGAFKEVATWAGPDEQAPAET